MRCPKCAYEPRDRLLHKPCPRCGHEWWDTESYVNVLSKGLDIKTVLDIGCGNKGVIAQYHWEHEQKIQMGYACDIHVIKALPGLWIPLLMDAEGLALKLGSDSIDFTTHCGFLEHVDYAKAFRVLRVIEQITKQRCFFTCSAVCREVDYKVKRDGNPYHYYKSFWSAEIFEALGYTVDRERMASRKTFIEEVTCWFDPPSINEPWNEREARAKQILIDRRCSRPGCNREPICWNPANPPGGGSWCFKCAEEETRMKLEDNAAPIRRWYDDPEKLKMFPYPPGREKLDLF
jgi:hypothetical protein